MNLYLPISVKTLTESNMPVYLDYCKRAKVDAVFICCFPQLGEPASLLEGDIARYEKYSGAFRAEGYKIGVWLDSFGHGAKLNHERDSIKRASYTSIRGFGLLGGKEKVYCPLDENFQKDYGKYIQRFASLHPDFIMLDDDFRFSVRGYGIGCACKLHMKAMKREVGFILGRKWLFNRIFWNKPSKYRDAWLKVSGESILNFARMLREKVNEIDGSIRLGACSSMDTWDGDGVDCLDIAKTLAGETKPFLRTMGAPYWATNNMANGNLGMVIEMNRQEIAHCIGSGVEVFTEGDVYPRPRYNVPASYLESFDLALAADGKADGILKYMIPYDLPADYENGYILHHEMNAPLKDEICKMFAGKSSVGVYVYNEMHKLQDADMRFNTRDISYLFPYDSGSKVKDAGMSLVRKAETFFTGTYKIGDIVNYQMVNRAHMLFSLNGIPTAYVSEHKQPVAVFGENARSVPFELLKGGAILDVAAAKILTERGIDVGYVGSVKHKYSTVFFVNADMEMPVSDVTAVGVIAKKKATPLAYYGGERHIAAYTYESQNGSRFFVVGLNLDSFKHESYNAFYNNYNMQNMLRSGIEWVGKKSLPVTCQGQTKLYVLASEAPNGDMAVGLFNLGEDSIIKPEIILAKEYPDAEFINSSGKTMGNKLVLDSVIPPYGVACINLKLHSQNLQE